MKILADLRLVPAGNPRDVGRARMGRDVMQQVKRLRARGITADVEALQMRLDDLAEIVDGLNVGDETAGLLMRTIGYALGDAVSLGAGERLPAEVEVERRVETHRNRGRTSREEAVADAKDKNADLKAWWEKRRHDGCSRNDLARLAQTALIDDRRPDSNVTRLSESRIKGLFSDWTKKARIGGLLEQRL